MFCLFFCLVPFGFGFMSFATIVCFLSSNCTMFALKLFFLQYYCFVLFLFGKPKTKVSSTREEKRPCMSLGINTWQ